MDSTRAVWRKASRSTGGGDNCVEVAALTRTVGIRDSKDPIAGPLHLTPAAWRNLTAQAKAGGLDL